MDTTTINSPIGGKSEKKRKVATHAGAAMGAAAVGVMGTAMAYGADENVDAVTEEPIVEDTHNQTDENLGESVTNATADTVSNNSSDTPEVVEEIVEEPQPIDSNGTAFSIEEEVPLSNEQATDPIQEDVNPDEIAEAIIAEDQIDPNDMDMADVVDFDEIGTVYTVDGESYTAAAFHDTAGNQLVMIDVDNDNTFDIITDEYGNVLTDSEGNLLAAGDITTDDVELALSDGNTYLAHNDLEVTDEFGSESIANDLIS